MTLAVVTDSAACLPAALAAQHGIRVVPLHATQGPDGSRTTARPSVAELEEVYRDALAGADEVLAIHLTAALSGTLENARAVAARLNSDDEHGNRTQPRIAVLDSGTCAAGLGFAALAAAQADDLRSGAARARESASRSRVILLVEDLAHLRRGGRIDRTTALMGGALGIRPILAVGPTGISVVETVRGAARARRQLVAQAVRAAGGTALHGPRPPASPVRLAVHYSDDPARGQDLESEVAEQMAASGAVVESVLRSPVDAALGVHVGPGALGVVVAPVLGAARPGRAGTR